MAVTIAILSSLCAALAAAYLYAEGRNSILKKSIEEKENKITELETQLKELQQNYRISEEAREKQNNKKAPRTVDFTNVFLR